MSAAGTAGIGGGVRGCGVPTRPGVAPSPARRALDLAASGAALLLLSPLLLLLWLAVRLTSPGPGLFRQVRVGQGGRPFTMLKFRSMRTVGGGPELTGLGDPRITPVGSLMRGCGLDELPQLWNILRGDMTLVGPRPETPGLAAGYPPECRWVFDHRPGLTGPGQIYARDRDNLAAVVDDQWYVAVLVLERVARDAAYLANPALVPTWHVLTDTARRVAGRPIRHDLRGT
jgi:lipopolysaccharide/colanic/teichoic acid biosynthesis glycosyltransferase